MKKVDATSVVITFFPNAILSSFMILNNLGLIIPFPGIVDFNPGENRVTVSPTELIFVWDKGGDIYLKTIEKNSNIEYKGREETGGMEVLENPIVQSFTNNTFVICWSP